MLSYLITVKAAYCDHDGTGKFDDIQRLISINYRTENMKIDFKTVINVSNTGKNTNSG